MRGRLIHWPGVLRLLGLVAIAIALIAAAALLPHRARPPVASTRLAAPSKPMNPLMRELARCEDIGETAENDFACLKVWSENRHHFFDGVGEVNGLLRARTNKAIRSASQP